MKTKYVISILVTMFLFAMLVIEVNHEYKPIKEQYENLIYQMDKLDCQDSLIVSDGAYGLVIADLSKQLGKIDHSGLTKSYIKIGEVSYRFLSIAKEKNKISYELAFGQDTTDISPWISISFSKEPKSYFNRDIMIIKMLEIKK